MSAIITPSGDYNFNLNASNVMNVTGDLSVAGNIFSGTGTFATNNINYGNSNVNIAASNSNVTIAVANASGNVATFTNTGLIIAGDLTVSGNATLSGNISGDHIDNGTTAIDIAVPNGNANINVGGVSNIAVFATTGVYVTGLISATSNVIANNVMATNIVDVASVTGTSVSVTANITGGNLLTAGLVSATSSVTSAANVIANNVMATTIVNVASFTGTVVSVTANVTGGNLVTAGQVAATANITGGNLVTAGAVSATGNVTGGNVNTGTVRNGSGTLIVSTGAGDINLNPAGNVVVNNTYINGLAQPVQDNDAASKIYVDNAVSTALTYHQPVAAATTTTLATATGGTITYAQPNGAGNGIGATLTTTGTFYLIDTANIQTVGTRVLVKDEGNAVFNGVYTYANTTNLVRSTDADQFGLDSSETLSLNDYFFVQGGTVNAGAAFVVSAPTGTITFGTSNIAFSQFSSSQTYSANTAAGISLSGTVINALVDNITTAFDGSGNIVVKSSAQLTTPNIGAATGTSLTTTGNVQGGNLFTAGAISATGTITSAANVAGVYFIGNGSQLTGIAVAGSTGGMIISGTSNVRVADSGNTTVGYQGNTVAEFSGTGAYITGLLSATGNISAPYFIGNGSALTGISSNKIYNGTSEANIGASNGNANITIGGVANVAVFTTAGLNVTGITSSSGNVVGGNLVTGGQISATANVSGGNLLTGGLASVTGNISGGNLLTGALVSATSMVAAGNVTGGNLLTGGLISAASGITAAANITGGNLLTAGLVSATGNVTGNYILGNGALLTGVITSVANINSGTSNVTVVSSGGNVAVGVGGTSNVAVFATTGEYVTGVISATGNITGGNLFTSGSISATGNSTVSGSLLVNSGGLRYNELDVLGNAGLYVGYATSAGNSLGAQLYLGDATLDTASFYNAAPGIGAVFNSSVGAAGDLAFYTFTGLNSRTEKVRINTNGNVGIACTTPTYKLEVVGTGYFSSGLTGGNLITGGVVTATGNVDAGNVNTSGLITATGNITGGNLLTTGLISATGNITGGNVLGGANVNATTHTGTTVSVTANITGGNLLTGGLISATSSITAAANITGGNILTGGLISATANITGGNMLTGGLISATSSITAAANITGGNILTGGLISATGNITGGNLSVGTGTITGGNIVNANGNGIGNIGSSSLYFNTVFAKATSAQYADLAEMYTADNDYAAGTVVIFGGTQEVTQATLSDDRRVAGVVSTNPSYLMNSTQQGEHVLPIAMTGRVPCLVTGTIHKGDLMVTAGNGHAQANNQAATGTVIGKALQDYSGESGMIEVVVGRV